jgi:arylsulfatase A-like enzyme
VTLESGRGDFSRSKRSPYERGVRTPVLVRWPGHVAAGRRPQVVSTVDIAPTVLAACGVEAPANLPGLDLVGLAADPEAERGPVFGGAWAHDQVDAEDAAASLEARFVVDGADKLILPVAPDRPAELYDVLTDPDEHNDRAAAEPQRVASLRALLDAWWRLPGR